MRVNSIAQTKNGYKTNFKSTYRIPLTQAGVNPAKKEALRDFLEKEWPTHSFVPSSNGGYARISVRSKADPTIIEKLKQLNFRDYQIFEKHNVPKEKMDEYIRDCLNSLNYQEHLGDKRDALVHKKKEGKFQY